MTTTVTATLRDERRVLGALIELMGANPHKDGFTVRQVAGLARLPQLTTRLILTGLKANALTAQQPEEAYGWYLPWLDMEG